MLLLVRLVTIISFLFGPQAVGASIAKPGCPEKCKGITVPYPFGIGEGCFLDKAFELRCNQSEARTPLHLVNGDFPVVDISLDHVGILHNATSGCFDKFGGRSVRYVQYDVGDNQFSYSHTQNKLVAIGCDIFAYISDSATTMDTSGCASLCGKKTKKRSPYCFDCDFCQTAMPEDLTRFRLRVDSMNTENRSWITSPCSLAFIIKRDHGEVFLFNISKIARFIFSVPVILNWKIGNISCQEAQGRGSCLCGKNSHCSDSAGGLGYRCRCMLGYHGNPYLPDGCQDVDECADPKKDPCKNRGNCVNTPGSFFCTCPRGYNSSRSRDTSCLVDDSERDTHYAVLLGRFLSLVAAPFVLDLLALTFVALAGLGIAFFILIVVAMFSKLRHELEEKRKNEMKRTFFKRNGGLLLEQQMSSDKGNVVKTKVFGLEELEKATDDFNKNRVLGKGGGGTVFKGMLSDGSIVAVKKSNIVDESQVSHFINEVFILSQIDHRNIVKLLGCCLETEVPLLIYEYISNGTLAHHLHGEHHASPLSWETRLRIAAEVAGALAYLHSWASRAIFHRDIKSNNILLDKDCRAVVSDFGISRSMPINKTHLTTMFGGTFGYLDPHFFRSGQFTDKSDVYAFGVVLAELLTAIKAASSSRCEEGLVEYFRSSMKQNRLLEIVEKSVVEEAKEEEIFAFANVARRCLKMNIKKRPGMIEVAADLDRLRTMHDDTVGEE